MNDLLSFLRRPEHTGENRCWPCTVLNTLLVGVITVVCLRRGHRKLALASAFGGVTAIGLRGYVVPGTPRFAPQLAARLPVDVFDHEGSESTRIEFESSESEVRQEEPADGLIEPTGEAVPDGDEIVAALLEAGVVVPDGEEFILDSAFRDHWYDEMRQLGHRDVEELASVAAEVTPSSISTDTYDGWTKSYVVLSPENGEATTLPRPIAIAELAAVRALESELEDQFLRLVSARPIRTFLDQCPLCEGELTTTQAACCGEVTPVGSQPREKLVCPSCNIRLFTFEPAQLE
ncbi:hypothetical protein OB919_14520 [Halobacteria archaeon AArc-curdl1]|uniref:Uncharacterized protein n=1 Tax=Natronosalvus hydrolyticus TaxID=2979988 RepID=A0AAP3E740_9EURY|nr:hypothetical protein [Halobacteria archaeon AArc-curdl1]